MDTKKIRRSAATVLLVAAVVLALMGLAMLSVVSGSSAEFGNTYRSILIINIIAALVLLLLIAGNLVRLYRDFRKRLTGARLKARLVAAFVALVIVPMAVVYSYSVQFLNEGIESWFDLQVEQGLGDALELSRVALDVRIRGNLGQTRRLAEGLHSVGDADMYLYLSRLREEAGAQDVTVSAGATRIVATSSSDPLNQTPLLPNEEIMLSLRRDGYYARLEPVASGNYRVRTAVALPGRFVSDTRVLQAIYPLGNQMGLLADSVEATASRYAELSFLRDPLKSTFILTLSLVVLISLLLAVYGAFFFARRLTAPLQNLVAGTRAVARGEFDTPLPPANNDEIGLLVDSFNDMMGQLGTAHEEARRSEAQVENERASLEAILGRLSSGVLAVENNLTIRTANDSAGQILDCDFSDCEGMSVLKLAKNNPVLKQFVDICAEFIREGRTEWREQMTLNAGGERRALVCSCTILPPSYRSPSGYVIVFEDVTELLRAQRDAAWGEVARRLAHEIKNPLTPIKLSAERIRHKYLDLIAEPDAEALDLSTRTIIKQVEAMRDMVNAFSEYARAPELNLVETDCNRLIKNVADLYAAHAGSAQIHLNLDEDLPLLKIDALRMRQVLHNIIRNATEALEDVPDGEVCITTSVGSYKEHSRAVITFEDNGPGFPDEHLEEIFEPYVTTKPKGTGLGLAIVRKLVEEHGGNVLIDRETVSGATIRIYLPLQEIGEEAGEATGEIGVNNNQQHTQRKLA